MGITERGHPRCTPGDRPAHRRVAECGRTARCLERIALLTWPTA